jgi:hypothetical protein
LLIWKWGFFFFCLSSASYCTCDLLPASFNHSTYLPTYLPSHVTGREKRALLSRPKKGSLRSWTHISILQ